MKKTNQKCSYKGPLTFEIGEIELIDREIDQPINGKKTSKLKLFLWFGFWALVILVCGVLCC
jgi:hypothetical protein